jgi:hypothetical protein
LSHQNAARAVKKFIVEHFLPGKVKLTSDEINAIAVRLSEVSQNTDAPYHWIQTYITDCKLYSVHLADDVLAIEEHARRGGFPVDIISEVKQVIDPSDC